MMATLAMIREKYGGPAGYMTKMCGLTKEEVEAIKTNLIVPDAAVYQAGS